MISLVSRHTTVFLLAASLFTRENAVAFEPEPLLASELGRACEHYIRTDALSKPDELSAVCKSFLQGFFAATDDVITTENIPSDLIVRMMKTRGARLSEQQQKTFKAEFCISETVTLKNIAEQLVKFNREKTGIDFAAELLRDMLAEHYPCK